MKYLKILLCLLVISSCNQHKETSQDATTINNSQTSTQPGTPLAASIETAHNKTDFNRQEAISFDLHLVMGGEERVNAGITSLTNSSKIRMDKKDGSRLIFDGENVFSDSKAGQDEKARFDIFTWQYFFLLPFKLTDPGTQWEGMQVQNIRGESFNRGKLIFEKNIGDAPDDWYVIYQEPNSELMYAAAYIVTYGTSRDKAEENPHVIVYHDYVQVEGVALATKWTFHNWSESQGIGEQLGEAKITNIKFLNPKQSFFEAPNGAEQVTK